MTIEPAEECVPLAAIAERLATAYWLLMNTHAAGHELALDALFDALGSVDQLAGALTTPSVRAVLDYQPL